jgi:membrane-associated phospholipid phosphatase
MKTVQRIMQKLSVLSPQTWRQIAVTFGMVAVPVFGFVQVADEVRDRDTLGFDEAVLQAINTIASPWLNAVVAGLTELGGVIGVIAITAGLSVLLWRRRLRLKAAQLVLGVGGAVLLNVLLKAVFQRDRPALWERIVTENSYSFPSGHAMASSALALSIIVLFWPTRWRWVAVAIAAVYMLVIAFTRLYLGVHYPTDIVAGWCVSAAWIAALGGLLTYRRSRRSRQRQAAQ